MGTLEQMLLGSIKRAGVKGPTVCKYCGTVFSTAHHLETHYAIEHYQEVFAGEYIKLLFFRFTGSPEV